jgi:hypothetical protein
MKKSLTGVYGLKRANWPEAIDVGAMSPKKFASIFESLKGEI